MSNKANKLIRSLLLGAVASLYNTSLQAENPDQLQTDGLSDDQNKDVVRALNKKTFHNVLSITTSGEAEVIAAHRSHSSHSSHSSHRSGSSGHYSGHASHSSSSYSTTYSTGSSSTSSTSTSTVSSFYSTSAKANTDYSFGERSISIGTYGKDVQHITDMLREKMYLSIQWITMKDGYPVFDDKVRDAIKRFQKDAGLPQDGRATTDLAMALFSWDVTKTTLVLGVRDLKYDVRSPLYGDDVTNLVNLLTKAGFPPDPSMLEYQNGKLVFTSDVETAVRFFQAFNGLEVTGVVTQQTIAKLKGE